MNTLDKLRDMHSPLALKLGSWYPYNWVDTSYLPGAIQDILIELGLIAGCSIQLAETSLHRLRGRPLEVIRRHPNCNTLIDGVAYAVLREYTGSRFSIRLIDSFDNHSIYSIDSGHQLYDLHFHPKVHQKPGHYVQQVLRALKKLDPHRVYSLYTTSHGIGEELAKNYGYKTSTFPTTPNPSLRLFFTWLNRAFAPEEQKHSPPRILFIPATDTIGSKQQD